MVTATRRCRQCESTDIEICSSTARPPSYSAQHDDRGTKRASRTVSNSAEATQTSTPPTGATVDLEAAVGHHTAPTAPQNTRARWSHWCSLLALLQPMAFSVMYILPLYGVICGPWTYNEVMLALVIHFISLPAFLGCAGSSAHHTQWMCSLAVTIIACIVAGVIRMAIIADDSGCRADLYRFNTVLAGTP